MTDSYYVSVHADGSTETFEVQPGTDHIVRAGILKRAVRGDLTLAASTASVSTFMKLDRDGSLLGVNSTAAAIVRAFGMTLTVLDNDLCGTVVFTGGGYAGLTFAEAGGIRDLAEANRARPTEPFADAAEEPIERDELERRLKDALHIALVDVALYDDLDVDVDGPFAILTQRSTESGKAVARFEVRFAISDLD